MLLNSGLLQLALLAVGLGCAATSRGAYAFNPEPSDLPPIVGWVEKEYFRQTGIQAQERYRMRLPIPGAAQQEDLSATVAGAHPAGHQPKAPARTHPSPEPAGGLRQMLLAVLLLFGGTLAARQFGSRIAASGGRWAGPGLAAPLAAAGLCSKVRAEEEAFSEFLAGFEVGLPAASRVGASAARPPTAAAAGEKGPGDCRPDCDPAGAFLAQAPELVLALRKLLQEIGPAPNVAARQEMLGNLRGQIRALKGKAGLPQLLPIWQLASATAGLLQQLTAKAGNVTSSTLHTVASAVDLLDDLCRPGLKADLATNPPLRFLVVDDDRISRHAVSYALKRAFNAPDLAEHGAAALALAAKQPYDVIFLDVQMPGLNGFEVCSRIHQTAHNRAAPVVFVTCHSDLNARAQSTLSGGHDLIGKPFLTFEITVKALTFALRHRIEKRAQARRQRGLAQLTSRTMSKPPKGLGTRTVQAGSSHHCPSTMNR